MPSLSKHPVHLGLGATAVPQPEFTGAMDWYMTYGQAHASDGTEGRLVSMHTFSEPWGVWEMHPLGTEVVVCVSGSVTLIQQQPDGTERSVVLGAGEYEINPPGVWHTADVSLPATVLFITAGKDTQNRVRERSH